MDRRGAAVAGDRLCLALTIVPHFLDARYYRGPVSDHFDGEHFFNPDGDDEVFTPTERLGDDRALRDRQ